MKYICNVNTPKINESHPNSIRHLTACSNWTIHIDETGNKFGEHDKKSKEPERTGKFVALVVAKTAKLPELKHNFHATEIQQSEEEQQQLDNIINTILENKNKVGVLGIQYNDPITQRHMNWFNGIYTLIKLVLRLLPIEKPKKGGNNSIKIFIEQRGDYKQRELIEVKDIILSDLKSIDPERFSCCGLSIKFTTKQDDKYNGYVDTLAHCWGGGSIAQERRKKAKFSGHCFLNITDKQIERLYALMGDDKKLINPSDWYDMMQIASKEPTDSLLYSYLNNIKEMCRIDKSKKNWLAYLQEVQTRLSYKDYNANQLAYILEWLLQAKPTKATFPSMLQLQLLSAQLASQNHSGQADQAKLSEIFELATPLIEENAQQIAHIYLRLSTAYANRFDFDKMKDILSQEIMSNKLAIGRSNYAKTRSSLGQYHCFIGEHEQAIPFFEEAIKEFSQLSDLEQAQLNKLQTETYLMFACLPLKSIAQKMLQQLFNTPELHKSVEIYAQNLRHETLSLSENDMNYKFKHQVILRMLNQGYFNDYKKNYLKHQAHWHQEQHISHPYQSITFWRGVLLVEDNQPVAAKKCFDLLFDALTKMPYENITLIWIYLVYIIAIKQLGYDTPQHIETICYDHVKMLPIEYLRLLDELKQTQDINEIRQLVLKCLPFNYA